MSVELSPAERQAAARAEFLKAFDEFCPGVVGNPFIPHWPHPKQAILLAASAQGNKDGTPYEALFGGAAGGGKMLPLSTPIPTPDRGFVPLEAVRPGDALFGRDGARITVLAESEILNVPGYMFTFDDGSTVESNDEHLWLTFTAAELAAEARRCPEWRARRRANRPSRALGRRSPAFVAAVTARNKRLRPPTLDAPTGTVRTTVEIVATLRNERGRANHAIPVCGAIEMPDAELPLDPYLLGCWLGDGTTKAGTITSMDEFVFAAFDQHFARGSNHLKPSNRASTQSYLGLRQVLRSIGVFGNKHVPNRYLWASADQRLALLQGLLDTDGCVERRSVSFCSTNKALANAVAFLARSFGWRANVCEGRARLYGEDCGPKYIVKFCPTRQVFRLPRKAEKLVTEHPRTRYRYIVSAERIDARPMKCIKVSAEDGLFLCTENLIPTHNSDALLMAAAQYLHVPQYRAMLIRQTYAELTRAGALMDRAMKWWLPIKGVRWNGDEKRFTFPSGATVEFGYHSHPTDDAKFHGGEWHFVGFDELTNWKDKSAFEWVRSRIRKNEGDRVPLRIVATANPGGPGHEWVKERFIDAGTKKVGHFFPSTINDNPSLDREAYIRTLSSMHPTRREQLLLGNWDAREPGQYFRREWFGPLLDPAKDTWPAADCIRVRWWDLAASEKETAARTAGVRMARHRSGVRAIEHAVAFRKNPGARDDAIIQVAQGDGHSVTVGLEIEPGSGGIAQYLALEKRLRELGFRVVGARPKVERSDNEEMLVVRSTNNLAGKAGRAAPVASCLERGFQRRADLGSDPASTYYGKDQGKATTLHGDGLRIFSGPWTNDYMSEVEAFPDGATCDLVDATSGAWAWLETRDATFRKISSAAAGPGYDGERQDVHPEDRPESSCGARMPGLPPKRQRWVP